MIAYGWMYVYRDYSSETFPEWGSAVRDLTARFPAVAPFAEYFLTMEPIRDPAAPLEAVDVDFPEPGPSSFSVRV
jgi:hypothetical protein